MQKATVTETAREHQSKFASNVDKKILDRIQKCLNRAHHTNTSEAEAKAALFVSQKLMSQHNVTQADLMAADQNDNKAHYGGQSIVRITKIAGSSDRVVREGFTRKLARAMSTLFDCRSFSTDYRTHVGWTFFGIADNTVAAAMGFEMAHNKILEWACAYKGGSPTCSYRLGVADGLAAMAYREKKRELHDVQLKELDFIAAKEREEGLERQRGLDRLQNLPASLADSSPLDAAKDVAEMMRDPDMTNSDNESEVDGLDIKADFDAEDTKVIDLCDNVDESIERFTKRELSEPLDPYKIPQFQPKPDARTKMEPESRSKLLLCPWDSGMQLDQFRATAEQVADDYLKQKSIKLRNRKHRKSPARDKDAYRQGQRDSAKIDVRH